MTGRVTNFIFDQFQHTSTPHKGVDATTHWFDVEQAHLSFQRQPQSSDSSMPSLRRLVRPTDWETVRSKLKTVRDWGWKAGGVYCATSKSQNLGGIGVRW